MNILYSQTAGLEEVQSHFRLKNAGHILAFRRNLFVQQGNQAPVITIGPDHKRKLEIGHWGLMSADSGYVACLAGLDIPKWHQMMEPPRRCLIPLTGFGVGADPTWFCVESNMPFSLFAVAGIVFRRAGRLKFLMITVPSDMAVHSFSRVMPMILKPDEYACWLHAPWDFASERVAPYSGRDLHVVNAFSRALVG